MSSSLAAGGADRRFPNSSCAAPLTVVESSSSPPPALPFEPVASLRSRPHSSASLPAREGRERHFFSPAESPEIAIPFGAREVPRGRAKWGLGGGPSVTPDAKLLELLPQVSLDRTREGPGEAARGWTADQEQLLTNEEQTRKSEAADSEGSYSAMQSLLTRETDICFSMALLLIEILRDGDEAEVVAMNDEETSCYQLSPTPREERSRHLPDEKGQRVDEEGLADECSTSPAADDADRPQGKIVGNGCLRGVDLSFPNATAETSRLFLLVNLFAEVVKVLGSPEGQ